MVALEACLGATQVAIEVVEVVTRVPGCLVPVVASCSVVGSPALPLVCYR